MFSRLLFILRRRHPRHLFEDAAEILLVGIAHKCIDVLVAVGGIEQ